MPPWTPARHHVASRSTGVKRHRQHQIMRSRGSLHWTGVASWRNLSRRLPISVLLDSWRQSKILVVSHNAQEIFIRCYLIRLGCIAGLLQHLSGPSISRRIVYNTYLDAKAYYRRASVKHCFVPSNKAVEALFDAEMKNHPPCRTKSILIHRRLVLKSLAGTQWH